MVFNRRKGSTSLAFEEVPSMSTVTHSRDKHLTIVTFLSYLFVRWSQFNQYRCQHLPELEGLPNMSTITQLRF